MRELDGRQANGMDVRLLSREADGSVFVAVDDPRTGEAFSVEVREDERPLEVFNRCLRLRGLGENEMTEVP
jgi:hypothetical protein